MARNAIQFQKGLSEVAFQENYGTEAQCESSFGDYALARWLRLPRVRR